MISYTCVNMRVIKPLAKIQIKFVHPFTNFRCLANCAKIDPEKVPKIKLNNGLKMPAFGLGTWNSKQNEVFDAVKHAIDSGYRHFDCAFVYGNEKELGDAIKEKINDGTVKRSDLFVVSKLWNTFHQPQDVEPSLKKSLNNVGLDYLDMYLMHFPIAFKEGGDLYPKDKNGQFLFSDADYVDTYKAMEPLVNKGLTKSIGVSNFNKAQIERVLKHCQIPPVTNQVECHPYLNQKKLAEYCKSKNIVITAYSQFGSPGSPIRKPNDPVALEDPTILNIAKKYKKFTGHVILRWVLQNGMIAIPKSVTKSRIYNNINIFDFSLDKTDMAEIDGLNRNHRIADFPFWKQSKHFPFNEPF